MKHTTRVLIVEDVLSDAELAERQLRADGVNCVFHRVETKDAFLDALERFKPDVILLDYHLPKFSALSALEITREQCLETPCIVYTGSISDEQAVETLKKGAVDYVLKNRMVQLAPAVHRALKQSRERGERKRAEEALHASEIRYRRLFEAAKDGILILDAGTGMIVDVNPFLAELLGYSHDQFLGKKVWEIGFFADILDNKEKFEELKRNEYVRYENLPLKTKDGRQIDVEFVSNVYPVNGRKVIQCNIRDNTERRKAEEELLLNEIRFRSLVDIFQHQAETTQEFLDHALGKAIELTRSKIGYIYFYNEENKQFVLNTWSHDVMKECAVLNPQSRYELEKTGLWGEAVRQRRTIVLNDYQEPNPLKKGHPEGHVALTRFMTVPVFSGDRIEAVVGVANKETNYEDVDVLQLTLLMDGVWKEVERKRASEELRESRASLSRAQETAHLGSWDWDIAGSKLHWSDELYRIFGMDIRAELTYEGIVGRIHPDDRAHNQEFVDRLLASYDVDDIEFRVIRPDGTVRYISQQAKVSRDEHGKTAFVFGVMQDITERRLAEDRQKLAGEVLRLLSESIGEDTIVHDILQAVKNSTGIEAVGIRLKDGDDFPYTETNGFPDSFVEKERFLCARDDSGFVIRDTDGNASLECMCGNILGGRTDARRTFFTKGGSFWSNSTTELLASATEADLQTRTRNRCNGEGYESVALIPLRSHNSIIGLLQLNDRRRGCFTRNMIEFFEGIGHSIGVAIDRQRSDEALAQERNLLRTIIDNIPDVIYEKDAEGRMVVTNRAQTLLLGAETAGEVIGKTDFDFFPRELAEKYSSDEREIFRSGQPLIDIEESAMDPAGDVKWFSSTKVPLRDDRGEITGLVGVGRDITERKRAENRLQESRNYLDNIINAIGDPVFVNDDRFQFTLVNHAFCALLGKTREELIGATGLGFLPSDQMDHFLEVDRKVLSSGEDNLCEELLTDHAGNIRTIVTRKSLYLNSEGAKFIVGVIRDITERKQAEEALRESEIHFKALYQNNPIPTFTWKKEGDDFILVDFNKSAKILTSGKVAEFVGRSANEMYENRQKIKQDIQKCLERNEIIRTEVISENFMPGRLIISTFAPVPPNMVMIHLEDITERRQAEQEKEKILLWRQDVNRLQQSLLAAAPLENKLKMVTDSIVRIFGADFCRVWLIRPGDMCEHDCDHALVTEGPHICRYRDKCLHLMASSGRYTHTDGRVHRRVPFGCYKIGRVAADKEHKFLTNDVRNDPRVHNHEWAREQGLVSFAGYQLHVPGGETLGVLALFAAHPILPAEEALLEGLGSAVALVIQQAHAEEALHESEEKYRTLIESTDDYIFLVDRDLKYLYANEKYLSRYGVTLDELKKTTYREIHGASETQSFLHAVADVFESGATAQYSYCNKMDQRHFLRSLSPVRDAAGRVVSVSIVSKDITDLKQAEEQLQHSRDIQVVLNHLLSLSLGNLSIDEIMKRSLDRIFEIPWLVLESRGGIFLVEDEPGILVLKAQRGISKPILKACSRIPFGTCLCGRAARERKIQFADHVDERHDITYDGMRPHGHYCVPIMQAGTVLGVINLYVKEGHHQDIQEENFLLAVADTLAGAIQRTRMEDDIRESEDKFRKAFLTSPDSIVISRLDDGMFVSVNEGFSRITGYTESEIVGKTSLEIDIWKDPEDRRKVVEELQAKGEVSNYEALFLTKNSEMYGLMSASIIVLNGIPHILSIIRDITERKHAEKSIQNLNRMYVMLSRINETIIHTSSRAHLFEGVCKNAVEFGKFAFSWIGVLDHGGKSILSTAYSGNKDCPLILSASLDILDLDRREPVAEAISQQKCVVVNDIAIAPNMGGLKKDIVACGSRSVAAIPFFLNKQVFGVLVVCSDEVNFFTGEEIRLLKEIAADISYALDMLAEKEQRRKAEEELQESEERYRTIFEKIPVSIWEYDCGELFRHFEKMRGMRPGDITDYFENDPDIVITLISSLKLLDVNRETLRMYGARSKEDIFREFGAHRTPETTRVFRELAKSYLSGEKELVTETVNETLDGRKIDIILQVTLVGDKKNSNRALFTVVNITDQKNAARAIIENEKKYRELTETLPQPVYETDTAARLTYANRKTFEQFGFSTDDFDRGIHVFDLVAAEDRERMVAYYSQAFSNPGQHASEYTALKKDGATFPASLYTVSVVHDAVVTGTRGFIIDLTERVKAEIQFRQSQKMETIGQLAGGVAHDFNNILMAIMGYARFALQAVAADSPVYNDIMEIQKNAERAASLTKQLLAFSRRQRLEPRIVDINTHINELSKMLRRLIGENIELVILPEPNLWMVKVDPTQIEQVIINMAVNARDAMPGGGEIVILTENVELKSALTGDGLIVEGGEYIKISIADTGTGMNAETKSHLFEPFFTTKGQGKGTGLGLAMCYGIITQSSGHIAVESEPGKGSTFTIHLPRETDGTESARSSAAIPELTAGHETILIVEDESALRRVISRTLAMNGYRVLEAINGMDALQVVSTNGVTNVDFILTDVIMPLMGGVELVARVRELNPNIKVLFMSGYTDDLVFQSKVDKMNAQFLQKPVMSNDLLIKIRHMLDGK